MARVCIKGVNVFLKVLETVSCVVYFYRFELRCWVTRPITHGLVLYTFLLVLYFVLLGLPCQPGIAWSRLRRESPMREFPDETGLCTCLWRTDLMFSWCRTTPHTGKVATVPRQVVQGCMARMTLWVKPESSILNIVSSSSFCLSFCPDLLNYGL